MPSSKNKSQISRLTAFPGTTHSQKLKPVEPLTLFTEEDIRLFQEGNHFRIYEKMGSHLATFNKHAGVYFAVWAPNAKGVSVIGDFNEWKEEKHALFPRWDKSGIWEGFIAGLKREELYKYAVITEQGEKLEKADPYGNYFEVKPKTATITWDLDYKWTDGHWMRSRKKNNALDTAFSVYEVHLGSWRRPDPNDEDRYYTYEEITEKLVPYVKDLKFTHVEFMPVMEHPFDGSWGYQQTGFFAATSRFGTPQEFMEMVEAFHKAGIGVILDWVPSHFPGDGHGLHRFDGSFVYESEDRRKGYQPSWDSYVFNYGRGEVRSFLNSSAFFWLDKFHVDGLRVDGISSFIYLDFGRKEGEWEPNEHGGNENLQAIHFLKELNTAIYHDFPDVQTIAEESTSFYGVSKPVFLGGLGFGMKWMLGWMHDTLKYFGLDPYFRQYHHNELTFSSMYAFTENFMLPLSHDEVVHGKSPLIYKMAGDDWQKFANLRTVYTYMFTHPGSKLLFMGGEFGQTSEWHYQTELDWHLLQYDIHQGLQSLVRELNDLYRTLPALYEFQFEKDGFEWNDAEDREQSILVYERKGKKEKDRLIIALNMTPVPRHNYPIGLHFEESWVECFNSDDKKYGGSGVINEGVFEAKDEDWKGKPYSLRLTLPPLGGIILKKHGKAQSNRK